MIDRECIDCKRHIKVRNIIIFLILGLIVVLVIVKRDLLFGGDFLCNVVLICIVLLFVSIIKAYCNELQIKNEQQTKNTVAPISLVIKAFTDAAFQTLIVILGAVIAIHLTSEFERSKEEKNVYEALSSTSRDLDTQMLLLNKIIEEYNQGHIEYDILLQNAKVKTELIEQLLFSEDVINTVPDRGYSALLYDYRAIKDCLDLLQMDAYQNPNYTLAIYNLIVSSASDYIYSADQILKFTISHEITKEEFVNNLNEKAEKLKSNPYVIWYK